MKRVLLLFISTIFLGVIGCGGENPAPPPQPPQLNLNNATDQQQLQNMFALAQQTKSSCAQAGTQSMLPIMLALSGPNGTPGMQQPQGLQSVPPISGGCVDDLINFTLMYRSMKNGDYANTPETQPWYISQIAGIVSRVGANLVSKGFQLTQDVTQKLYLAAWQLVQRDVLNQPQLVPVRPAVCGGAAQYGVGC